jgi:hypothetical protein
MPYYGGHSTDIVGYAWDADVYCPRCTLERMGIGTTGPVRAGAVMESEIAIWVAEEGLEMHREDSQRVPQPIFNSDDARDNDSRAYRCGSCHEPLIETDEEEE